MKINVLGNAAVFTSTMKLEELQLLKKFRPEALTLYGGKDGDVPLFTISTEGGAGINEVGATFKDASRDGQGLATITMELTVGGDGEAVKAYIADKFGSALMHIEELEGKLPDVVREIAAQKASVMSQIHIG